MRCLFIVALALLTLTAPAQDSELTSPSPLLPYGHFPKLDTSSEGLDEVANPNLIGEIKGLSVELSRGVKKVAKKRSFTCLGDPCLLQAFPLVYTKINSGFFGGVRGNITNISRQQPFLYVGDFSVVRSDTKQWLSFAAIDFPRIEQIPLKPRLKARVHYSRTTETRYFGTGTDSESATLRPDVDARYGLQESGWSSAVVLPLIRKGNKSYGTFFSYAQSVSEIDPFTSGQSILYAERPAGTDGGSSLNIGAGVFLDERDEELFARDGKNLEISGLVGHTRETDLSFQRGTLVDRRYASYKRLTFAHRLTVDIINGNAPFWELAGVGGLNPISNVAGSGILKGYVPGRFHEKIKIIESLEMRTHQNPFRILGLQADLVLMPIALDIGALGNQGAWSLSSGSNILWNKSFLTKAYASYCPMGWNATLEFQQEF